jgi:hypothetical protein
MLSLGTRAVCRREAYVVEIGQKAYVVFLNNKSRIPLCHHPGLHRDL